MSAAKIDVVTNGVDADLFTPRPPDAALRARLGFAPDTFVVTFAGTIGMASGLEVALGAAAPSQGAGPRRHRLPARRRRRGARRARGAGARRGPDNVVFTGLVPRAELPDYLASSDACLVHFRKQALFSTILPSKFFEDAAMEKPILLGFEGDARAMLAEADCGIAFEPGNDAELAAAASGSPTTAAACRRLGENGRRYVLEHFDRRLLAHDYLEILERVRDGAGRGLGGGRRSARRSRACRAVLRSAGRAGRDPRAAIL